MFTPIQVQDISETVGLVWRLRGQRIPPMMRRSCSGAVVVEDRMYVLHGENRTILHSFYPRHQEWLTHTPPPVELGSLAKVNNRVVVVGGKNSKRLYSLIDGEWRNSLRSMPTKRHSTTVVSCGSYLIVIGGMGKGRKYLHTVEVMDVDDNSWFTVASFPGPSISLSACLCNGSVYALGGIGTKNSVFLSKLDTLLNSTRGSAVPESVSGVRVWERVQELPVSHATCVAAGNSLYAVGGKYCHGTPTTSVYHYNQRNRTWCVYANLQEARSQCFVAMVESPNTMVVVGGVTNSDMISRTTETASWRCVQL
jgi:N-acetylneuraminic acid mutarotase